MKRAPKLLSLVVTCALAACSAGSDGAPPPPGAGEGAGEGEGEGGGEGEGEGEAGGEGEGEGGGEGEGEGGGEGEGEEAPPSCVADAPVSGCAPDGDGDFACVLTHDGVERRYLLHVPPGDGETIAARPIVFAFHGLRTTASLQRWISRMNEDADARGTIVVYPEGLGEDVWTQSFNAGLCCGYASDNDVDDVGFTLAILEAVRAPLCVDAARVHATGLSNGGHMAYTLACEQADVFASVAAVAGMVVKLPCTPSRPVPVLHFHGTEDDVVDYDGYGGFMGAEDTVAGWAERNGCVGAPQTSYDEGEVTCVAYQGCAAQSDVELCTVEGGGHTWPGGEDFGALGHTTQDISATDRIGAFFAAHPMP